MEVKKNIKKEENLKKNLKNLKKEEDIQKEAERENRPARDKNNFFNFILIIT